MFAVLYKNMSRKKKQLSIELNKQEEELPINIDGTVWS